LAQELIPRQEYEMLLGALKERNPFRAIGGVTLCQ
jgi:hypothetical protein